MPSNATILRLDRRSGTDAAGNDRYLQGSALEVRCQVSGVSTKQHWQLGATIKDAERVVYLNKNVAIAGGISQAPALGDRLTLLIDGPLQSPRTMQAVTVGDQVAGVLSHWEVYLKPV